MITQNSLQKAIGQVGALDSDGVVDLVAEFSRQQPHIFSMVGGFSGDMRDSDAFAALLEITLVIWQAFLEEFQSIPTIREKDIFSKEQEGLDSLDHFTDMSEEEMEIFSAQFIESQNQPILFNYVTLELIELFEENEDEEDTAEEMEILFPLLKLIIDLFDDEINRPRMWVV